MVPTIKTHHTCIHSDKYDYACGKCIDKTVKNERQIIIEEFSKITNKQYKFLKRKIMHKHIFKNIGGGMNLVSGKSDDHYRCECNLEFKIYSDAVGHRFLPEIIKQETFSEVKQAEQNAILDSQFNLNNNGRNK